MLPGNQPLRCREIIAPAIHDRGKWAPANDRRRHRGHWPRGALLVPVAITSSPAALAASSRPEFLMLGNRRAVRAGGDCVDARPGRFQPPRMVILASLSPSRSKTNFERPLA